MKTKNLYAIFVSALLFPVTVVATSGESSHHTLDESQPPVHETRKHFIKKEYTHFDELISKGKEDKVRTKVETLIQRIDTHIENAANNTKQLDRLQKAKGALEDMRQSDNLAEEFMRLKEQHGAAPQRMSEESTYNQYIEPEHIPEAQAE